MGVYTVEKSRGISVRISYTRSDGWRVRETVKFVERGKEFGKRLAEAKRKAKRDLAIEEGKSLEGRLKRPKQRRVPTFAEYVEKTYISAMRMGTNSSREKMKTRSLQRETQRLTSGTLSWFGPYPLDRINRELIEKFMTRRLEDEVGAAGLNRDLARLRNLLNDAGDRDSLSDISWPRIPWKKLTQTEHPESYRPMRDDEERRLLIELSDRIVRDLVEFLLHTGVRPEATFSLLWKHVDLERMVVEIPRDLDKVSTGYLVYPNSRVQEVLRSLYAWRPERHRQPDTHVFAHRNGKKRRSIRESWRGACERAGIEGLQVRGLRSTAATRLQEGGATELDIKLHLGHTTKSMGVTSRYVDPHEEHRRRIAELTIRHRPSNVLEMRPWEGRAGSTTEALSGTLSG